MKNIKRIVALMLCAVMVFSLAACSNSGETNVVTETVVAENGDAASTVSNGKTRTINIGTWWTQHYDSADTSLEDSADYVNAIDQDTDTESDKATNAINRNVAELKFANVSTIESKYNCKFYWKNLTYTGVTESINISIPAGSPDCDIYLVDAQMAYPAQLNGLALDLKTVLPADHDLFTDQIVASYIDLGDGKACILQRQGATIQTNTYPLAFNLQMLQDNNLEDPRDLWERGEWTWDKFNEYCQILTQDTDGDGQIDQYGYCGYQIETFEQLMMSNGASIASGSTQTLTDSKVGEALQEMQDLYNSLNVAYPYDVEDPSNSMRNQYTEGNIAFFPIAQWIESGNGDYDWDGSLGYDSLTWDVAYVRWPVGPSGNAATNAGLNNVGSELYIIPAGVSDPETVFGVLYDMWNWYDFDTTLRDDPATYNWWYQTTGRSTNPDLQMANFNVHVDCTNHTACDLWQQVYDGYDLISIINGTMTPAQFQETYKQDVQDGIDQFYGN